MSATVTPRAAVPARRTPTELSSAQATWLVAEREIGSKLRSKSFVISSVILVLIALGSVLWGGFTAGQDSSIKIAAPADAGALLADTPGLEVVETTDRAAAEALVRDGEVEAAVVVDAESPVGLTIIADSDTPSGLEQALAVKADVVLLDPDALNPLLRYFVALGFGVVFFMAALTFGATIAASVVEEKQTRVVEILISAIPTRVLLAGKVIGNTILAMGQILLLAAAVVLALVVTGQTELLQGLGAPVVWFAVFFLFGFILTAAMFAATGAMVSRQEDIGSTTGPVTYLVMAPYILVILFNDNPLVMTIMSYVPFSAPVGMPVRLFFGEAQWWEPLLSLAILLASCLLVIGIGARIYENSLLRMGARVKLSDALRS
ncbi:ABC transporter permease [Microbacterium marinilacus]|uniref:ABC transporter permease n=1 Tax=Microbacterium marinilacus TaxID=415209 RepID=A0ABP7BL84_9MICO|nr:ABC transporter permease [Microbacterium marinilacus]MBY0689675.1 ABC transporter permease [Microbacterium marinilacus]